IFLPRQRRVAAGKDGGMISMIQHYEAKGIKNVAFPLFLASLHLVVLCLLLSGGATASQVQEETRQLVMSKDDSICKPLLTIMNRYLTEEGRIDSKAQAGDLTLVSWEPIDVPDRRSTNQIPEKTLLDINNDGKREL